MFQTTNQSSWSYAEIQEIAGQSFRVGTQALKSQELDQWSQWYTSSFSSCEVNPQAFMVAIWAWVWAWAFLRAWCSDIRKFHKVAGKKRKVRKREQTHGDSKYVDSKWSKKTTLIQKKYVDSNAVVYESIADGLKYIVMSIYTSYIYYIYTHNKYIYNKYIYIYVYIYIHMNYPQLVAA